jgi:divalent metal cation (Fe/Co/Zn/Cd) transporter
MFTGLIGFGAVVVGFLYNVVALLGLGFESLLDMLSSILVLWRFKKAKTRAFGTMEEAEAKKVSRDRVRESNSLKFMAATFAILGLVLVFKGMHKLFAEHTVEGAELEIGAETTLILSWPAAVGFAALAVEKYRLATELESAVVMKDCMCTVGSTVLAAVTGVAGIIEDFGFASADPVAAVLVGVFMLVEAARAVKESRALSAEADSLVTSES